MGYPDYTTVQADPVPGGARLIIDARQRFGRGDFGVNAARIRAWLAHPLLKGHEVTSGG